MPALKIQGQIYRRVGSLLPTEVCLDRRFLVHPVAVPRSVRFQLCAEARHSLTQDASHEQVRCLQLRVQGSPQPRDGQLLIDDGDTIFN